MHVSTLRGEVQTRQGGIGWSRDKAASAASTCWPGTTPTSGPGSPSCTASVSTCD